MKFLVDVNASSSLASWLVGLGHDVAQVKDRDARMADGDILTWAVNEQRIIITTDQDFEEMIWREGKRHGGVLRLENLPRSQRKSLLEGVLSGYSQALVSGEVVIALSRKIRIRRPIGVSARSGSP
jgi:predicted nuclease of predicted toxin-antitoxin system